jgi:hypothetical protein
LNRWLVTIDSDVIHLGQITLAVIENHEDPNYWASRRTRENLAGDGEPVLAASFWA